MTYTVPTITRDLNKFKVKFKKEKYFNVTTYEFNLGGQPARLEAYKNGVTRLVFTALKKYKNVTRHNFQDLLAFYA